MANFQIPEKEKCPSNGYTVKYRKETIETFCEDPSKYNSSMYVGVINDAITIYKYSDYLTINWIKNVINSLSPYIK